MPRNTRSELIAAWRKNDKYCSRAITAKDKTMFVEKAKKMNRQLAKKNSE